MKSNFWMLALLGFAAVISLPGQAVAHSVETDYQQLIDGLEFTSTYSTGEPLEGATVEVYAPDDSSVPRFTGVMDAEGRFSFQPDTAVPGDWEIKIRQEGHGDIWTIPVKADGVDFENISEGPQSDVHYAALPTFALGTAVLAAGSATAVFTLSKRQRTSQ